MRIHLTDHARIRMRERNINRQQIEDCLGNFQISRPGEKGARIYDYIDEEGYKTSVTAITKSNSWVVVSVWRAKI